MKPSLRPRAVDIYHSFMLSRRAAHRADATLEWYESILPRMLEQIPDFPETEDLEHWLTSSPSDATTKNWIRAARAMWSWAAKRYHFESPAAALVTPECRPAMPRVFSSGELRRIMAAATDARDAAAIAVLIDTGIRIGELATLTVENIQEDGLQVSGKRGWRRVPLTAEARRALMRIAPTNGPVFMTEPRRRQRQTLSGIAIQPTMVRRRGAQPGNDNRRTHGRYSELDPVTPATTPARPMAKGTLELRIRDVFTRAGLTGSKLGPHTLRHTFATMYLRGGGDIYRLQRLMGHSHIKETMIYLHLADPEAFAEHARLSPLVQLREATP